jgi:hypothetical protein
MKVKLLEPIEGYEEIAELRLPKKGESYLSRLTQTIRVAKQDHSSFEKDVLVLTVIPKWRPATVEDGIRAIRGEKIVARFRNWTTEAWLYGELATVWPEAKGTRWGMRDSCSYLFCEVLDD